MEELVGFIGNQEVVSEVIEGKRVMTQAQVRAAGEFFKVAPSLFV